MGASPFRIITRVLLPEALGPLILGYTFVFISVVDATAVAGSVGGGGLGNFAIVYGYQRFNWWVTWAAVLTIIVLVQAAQFFGNWFVQQGPPALSHRVAHRCWLIHSLHLTRRRIIIGRNRIRSCSPPPSPPSPRVSTRSRTLMRPGWGSPSSCGCSTCSRRRGAG